MSSHMELLVDLHIDAERQGPGSDSATRQAIALAALEPGADLTIADIGCGTGAAARVLAGDLGASITAVDLLRPFLDRLDDDNRQLGLSDRITTLEASMDDLPFEPGSLDVIWSEGAIYTIGFEHGVRSWRPLLTPGGVLAVSEITWLTNERPAEIEKHWAEEYPEIATASSKFGVLERAGYTPIGYFTLPESCWLDHYYRPMQNRFASFLDRHQHSSTAREIVDTEQHEIDLYERYSSYVSYGFYLAARHGD